MRVIQTLRRNSRSEGKNKKDEYVFDNVGPIDCPPPKQKSAAGGRGGKRFSGDGFAALSHLKARESPTPDSGGHTPVPRAEADVSPLPPATPHNPGQGPSTRRHSNFKAVAVAAFTAAALQKKSEQHAGKRRPSGLPGHTHERRPSGLHGQAQERRPSGVHGRTQERRPSGVHGRTQERRPSGVHGRTQERRPSAATPATLSSPPSHEQAHAHASQGNAPPPDHEAPQLPQSAMQRQSTPPTPTATHTRQCSLDQSDVQLVATTNSASLRNAAPTTDSASLKNAAPEEGTTDEPVFESPQQWQRFQSGMVRRSSALGWRAARHAVMDECSEPPNPYLCSGAFSCMALRFADTGSFLAGTFFDGSLRIYDASRASRLHTVQVRTGGVVAKRQAEEERTGSATEEERNLGRIRANRNIATEVALTNVRWRLDRRGERILATTTSDGYIVLFGVNAAGIPTRLSCTTESPHSLSALAFNADGTRLVVGGADRVVRVHDVEVAKTVSGLRRCDKTIEGHVSRVVSLVAHPINPQVAFSGGLDHRIFTWDFRDRRHKRRMTTGVVLAGDALDVSKDGSSLIVGCHREERQIQIYDVRMDTAAVSALDVPGAASSRGAPSSETVHRKSSNLEPLMQRFGPRLRSSYHWAGDVDAVCRSTRPMTTLLFSLAWDSQTKLVATAGEKDNFAGILHVKNTEDEAGSAGVVETFYGKDTAFTYAAIDNDGLNAAFGCADGAVLFAKTQRA